MTSLFNINMDNFSIDKLQQNAQETFINGNGEPNTETKIVSGILAFVGGMLGYGVYSILFPGKKGHYIVTKTSSNIVTDIPAAR